MFSRQWVQMVLQVHWHPTDWVNWVNWVNRIRASAGSVKTSTFVCHDCVLSERGILAW
jgi:hypothetical protein